MHAAFDGLFCDFLGRGEERPDLDIKANVAKRARDNLLSAVVAVLSHLGDENFRTLAFSFFERMYALACAFHRGVVGRFTCEHTGNEPDWRLVPQKRALQRS